MSRFSEKGFAPILILIGVMVLVGIAYGVYYLGQANVKQAPAPQSVVSNPTTFPSPTQSVVARQPQLSVVANEITNWKTYQEVNAGFSFKYPANAQVSTGTAASMLSFKEDNSINVKPPYEVPYDQWYTMDLVVRDNSQGADAKTIIDKYIEDIKKTCSPPACGTPIMIQSTLKPYQNGVIDGYIFHIGAETDSAMVVQVKGNKTYIFRMSGDQGNVTDSGLKIFDQILSTFKFTNS